MDKLCPALRNHCLLGHSPRLFLQRPEEDIKLLVISMASVESYQFSTLSVSLLLWESSDPPPIQPSRILWHWFLCTTLPIQELRQCHTGKWWKVAWYAEITFWAGHNWGQLPRWWICWQHTACWMWQWSFSGFRSRNWTAMYGNAITRTLTKAMDIVPETI